MSEKSVSTSPRYSSRILSKEGDNTNVLKAKEIIHPRILKQLYMDSDEDCSEDAVVTNFNPFIKLGNSRCLPETLTYLSNKKKLVKDGNTNTCDTSACNAELTDSELLNHVLEAEEMLEGTPKKRLRLVNAILKDFEMSPYQAINASTSFLDYSPEFVLKSKPRITYSSMRRSARKIDCNKRLNFNSNNDCLSDTSSISVEENSSQLDDFSTLTVPLDTTNILCENLLNLSAFYTQADQAQEEQMPKLDYWPTFNSVTNLLDEICTLRKSCTYKLFEHNSHDEDFCGFSEEDSNRFTDSSIDNRCDTLDATLSTMYSQEFTKFVDSRNGQFDEWDAEGNDIFFLIKTPPQSCTKDNSKCKEEVQEHRNETIAYRFETASSKPIRTPENAKNRAAEVSQTDFSSKCLREDLPTTETVPFGFKTASSKPIQISENAKSKAADILRNLPDVGPGVTETDYSLKDLRNDPPSNTKISCGFKTASAKPIHISENAKSKATVLLRNLPVIGSEVTETDYSLKDLRDHPPLNEAISFSFKTASSKPIRISENAKSKATAFVSNLPVIGPEFNETDYSLKDLRNNPPPNEAISCGFKTASSKPIHISENAKSRAAEILNNLPDIGPVVNESDSILRDLRDDPPSIVTISCGFKTASAKPIHISENAKSKATVLLRNLPVIGSEVTETDNRVKDLRDHPPSNEAISFSFKTASSKPIRISEKAKSKATAIVSNLSVIGPEFNETDYSLNDLRNDPPSKAISCGFKTASSKPIHISENAKSRAAEIFNNLPDIGPFVNESDSILRDLRDDLPSTSKTALKENKEYLKKVAPINKEKIAGAAVKLKESNSSVSAAAQFPIISNHVTGLQTASGRNIKPTKRALKIVENLFESFQSDFEQNNIRTLTDGISQKENHKTIVKKTIQNKSAETDLANVIFSEWPLEEELQIKASPKKKEPKLELKFEDTHTSVSLQSKSDGCRTSGGTIVSMSEKSGHTAESLLKKLKDDCDSINLLETKNVIRKKNNQNVPDSKTVTIPHHYDAADSCNKEQCSQLCESQTVQSKSNSLTELSVKSPLNASITNLIIGRKNLLSLSKKRKKGRVMRTAETTHKNALAEAVSECSDISVITPHKTNTTQMAETPSSLNGSDSFIHASRTSTPRTKVNVRTPNAMDDDFKPIPWNDNKYFSGSCSNLKFNSPNPSATDRLARLRMYGDPPPISPIHTHCQSGCRPSGLKRTRTMLRKDENR